VRALPDRSIRHAHQDGRRQGTPRHVNFHVDRNSLDPEQ
jgi:hypothetical protein